MTLITSAANSEIRDFCRRRFAVGTLNHVGSFCFVLVFLLSIALPAQMHPQSPKDHPPSAYKLVSIKVTGTKRYQPEDVIRATGLQLGQVVHKEDLEDVVRLLGESGAFTDIFYSLEFDPVGTKLQLTVRNSNKFVPVNFRVPVRNIFREIG
jgi:outer membrane protein assembly factor BamA